MTESCEARTNQEKRHTRNKELTKEHRFTCSQQTKKKQNHHITAETQQQWTSQKITETIGRIQHDKTQTQTTTHKTNVKIDHLTTMGTLTRNHEIYMKTRNNRRWLSDVCCKVHRFGCLYNSCQDDFVDNPVTPSQLSQIKFMTKNCTVANSIQYPVLKACRKSRK